MYGKRIGDEEAINPTEDQLGQMVMKSAYKAKESNRSDSIPNSPNPLALSKWYAQEIKWVDEQIDIVENESGILNSCSKGCHACCNHPVSVSSTDIKAMLPYLKSLSREALLGLLEKVSTAIQKINDNNVLITDLGHNDSLSHKRNYFNARIPCPLLSDDGTCSVYHVRPSTCVTYRAYGNPNDCLNELDVKQSIAYEDWERILIERLFTASKPDRTD